MPEEAREEMRVTSRTPSLSTDRGGNRLCVVGSEVREASVLQVAPDLLLRIELGGVARKPERMPVWVLGQIGTDNLVPVGLALVP